MKWIGKDILLTSFKRILTTIAVILIILALIFVITISYLVGDSLVHPLIKTVLFFSTALKSHHISDNV